MSDGRAGLKGLFCIFGIFAILSTALLVFAAPPSEDYLRHRSVMLMGNGSTCSGVQIEAPSGENYILSAGHCADLATNVGMIQVKTEDGRILFRKVLAEDPASDLLLIEGIPDLRGIKIGRSLERGAHIRTFTHGGGLDTYKTEGVVIGTKKMIIPAFLIIDKIDNDRCEAGFKYIIVPVPPAAKVCVLVVIETATTAMIIPGSSGGMAVNDSGHLIGIASMTNGHIGFLVTLEDIQKFLADR